jgi:tetratricopeptide (TPR) repeat protein
MGQKENTVFISYRRTNLPWALAIYQNLTAHGYDVFFDFESINSGDFEQVILGNIRARAHFIVILTPSMLERINEPNDWVRLEIETALDEKRNIIPLFFEGFNFGTPAIASQLNGKLLLLKKYGGFDVPASYFQEAMERLRNRYLNVDLDAVIHPFSARVQEQVEKQQDAANKEMQVKEKELTAQEWYEKGYESADFDGQIYCYTEAIRLKLDYAIAYFARGNSRRGKGDLDGAIKDYTEAIHLKPDYTDVYNNRGVTYKNRGNLDDAIKDYTEAICIKPDFAEVYFNRGVARAYKGDLDGAIKDYTEAIRLKPDFAEAYNNRGVARSDTGDSDGAIKDYTDAIRTKPNFADAYYNRGVIRRDKDDVDGAIKDFTETIHLKSDYALVYRIRGTAWDKKGDYYSAIADYEKSVELGDKEPTVPPRIQELRKKIK